MYNWSVDEKQFKKADPKGYKIWRLEQMINYGLGWEKLNERDARKYWKQLHIDPKKRIFLGLLLQRSEKPSQTKKLKKKRN